MPIGLPQAWPSNARVSVSGLSGKFSFRFIVASRRWVGCIRWMISKGRVGREERGDYSFCRQHGQRFLFNSSFFGPAMAICVVSCGDVGMYMYMHVVLMRRGVLVNKFNVLCIHKKYELTRTLFAVIYQSRCCPTVRSQVLLPGYVHLMYT